jgi:hypothetical protein
MKCSSRYIASSQDKTLARERSSDYERIGPAAKWLVLLDMDSQVGCRHFFSTHFDFVLGRNGILALNQHHLFGP